MSITKTAGRIVRIAGDWMEDGYINNLNRRSRLACWMENGRLHEANEHEDGPETLGGDDYSLVVNSEGELAPATAPQHGLFLPHAGELARIGFVAA